MSTTLLIIDLAKLTRDRKKNEETMLIRKD
jgi:hypothetical protein